MIKFKKTKFIKHTIFFIVFSLLFGMFGCETKEEVKRRSGRGIYHGPFDGRGDKTYKKP